MNILTEEPVHQPIISKTMHPRTFRTAKKVAYTQIKLALGSYFTTFQDISMKPSVFMVFWRYASRIVITLLGRAKENIALRT